MVSGRRVARRLDEGTDLAVGLFCFMLVLLIGGAVLWGLSHAFPEADAAEELPSHPITHDSLAPTYTYDGEVIRWYVLVDPDTDVEYLVNDRGGCCPRLDHNGNVMGVSAYGG